MSNLDLHSAILADYGNFVRSFCLIADERAGVHRQARWRCSNDQGEMAACTATARERDRVGTHL
jgi:hypothetical protein